MKNFSYIKDFRLKGYKSIKDISGQFEKGLNIIIGNNGTGKTNLFDFFEKILIQDYTGLDVFSAVITVMDHSDKEIVRNVKGKITGQLSFNASQVLIEENGSEKPVNVQYVKYNLPEKLLLLDEEYNPRYNAQGHWFFESGNSGNLLPVLSIWLRFLFNQVSLSKIKDFENLTGERLYRDLQEGFDEMFSGVKDELKRFTPVEDIRFSDTIRIARIDASAYEFKNLVFEYKVHNEWFSWSALSEGTRRLVYIIFAVNGITIPDHQEDIDLTPVVFIEEPELGIHPHQLHLLLTCLKERSEHQQIIISTHSPQVLDVLGKEELHRIFITEIEPEKGTTIRKLNDGELAKAKEHLGGGGLLSVYWRFSDFQRSQVSM